MLNDYCISFEEILERQAPSALQYFLLSMLLLSLVIEGLDMQLLSLVSPRLVLEWKLRAGELGPAMSAALIGMSLGAVTGGWLGDRWGRKSVLAWSVLFFGIATICVAYSANLAQVTLFRLAGGLGFGAAGPNAVALASEWLGGRLRTRAIGLMSVGVPLGGMAGAVLLINVVSRVGWRGSFLLCGCASMLTAVGILAAVPESPSFLVARGRIGEVARLLKRWTGTEFNQGHPARGHPAQGQPARGHPARGSLSTGASRRVDDDAIAATTGTPVSRRLLWGSSLTFFSASFLAYACVAWLPVLLTMNGLSLEHGFRTVFWFNCFAVISAVGAGYLVSVIGSRRLMNMGTLAAGAAVILLATSLGPPWVSLFSSSRAVLDVAAGLAGGGTGTVLSTVYMVIVAGYPVTRRSAGIGVGMTLGRAGGIISTFVGGYLLGAAPDQSRGFFIVLLLGILSTFMGILIVDRHLMDRAVGAVE